MSVRFAVDAAEAIRPHLYDLGAIGLVGVCSV